MQLPQFRSQAGVSMDSARVSPARISQPSPIRAKTHNWKPSQSVSGAYNEKLQSDGLDQALNIGMKVLDFAMQIDNANQDMAQKAAQAEYKNHMAAWQTSFEATAMEVNEKTGEANWKTYEEDAAKAREQAKLIMRDKHKFSGKKRELEWKMNTDGTDTALSNHAIKFTSRHKTAEAEVKYKIAEKNATSIGELDALNRKAVNDGIIYDAQAAESRQNFLVKQQYNGLMASMETQAPQNVSKLISEMQQGTSARAMTYTAAARNNLIAAGRQRIENVHRERLVDHYDREGAAGMYKYIQSMEQGGPEASGTPDYISHDALISKLYTRFNGVKKREEAYTDDMTVSNIVGDHASGSRAAGDFLNASNVENSDAKKAASRVSMEIIGKNPYSEEAFDRVQKEMSSGYITDYTKTVYSQDLKSNDPQRVAASLSVFEKFEREHSAPATQEMLKSQGAKDKYEFYKGMKRAGMFDPNDPNSVRDLNKEYNRIMTLGQTEYNSLKRSGRASLTENGGSRKVFEEGMSKLGITNAQTTDSILDLWGLASDDDIAATPWIESSFTAAYEHTYALTGSHEAASMAAAEAVTTTFGATTSYNPNGDPILEQNSPELMLGGQGHVGGVGVPSSFINQQHVDMVNEASQIRQEAGYEGLDVSTSRRVYGGKDSADGQHFWFLYDANGALVTMPGNSEEGIPARPLQMKYETVDGVKREQEVNMSDMNAVQAVDAGYMQLLGERNMGIPPATAKNPIGRSWYTSFQTDENGDISGIGVNPDGWYDSGRTVMDVSYENADVWSTLSDDEIKRENEKWYKGYNTLMQVLAEEHAQRMPDTEFNKEVADLKVRHHLNSRGLMHGNEKDQFIYPPSTNDPTFNKMVPK